MQVANNVVNDGIHIEDLEDPLPDPIVSRALRDVEIILLRNNNNNNNNNEEGQPQPPQQQLVKVFLMDEGRQRAYHRNRRLAELPYNRGQVWLCQLLMRVGHDSVTYLSIFEETTTQVVVKKVRQRRNALENPRKEIAVMQLFAQPNNDDSDDNNDNNSRHAILHCIQAMRDPRYWYIITDYFPQQDLSQIAEALRLRFQPNQQQQQLTRTLITNLQYIHNQCRIVHCDISPDNILVKTIDNNNNNQQQQHDHDPNNNNDQFPLFDFAFSIRFQPNVRPTPPLRGVVGKLPYMSPKVLSQEPHDISVYTLDLWSMGATLFTILASINIPQEHFHRNIPLVLYNMPTDADRGFNLFITHQGLINDGPINSVLELIQPQAHQYPAMMVIMVRILAIQSIPMPARNFIWQMFQPHVTIEQLLQHEWLN